jgi:predicted HTH domain antitoxin
MNTEITISVPVEIAANLALDESDLSRKTLEALAIEGYRQEHLSLGQLAEMLDLSVLEAEEFLHAKNVSLNYSITDFDDDLETASALNRK